MLCIAQQGGAKWGDLNLAERKTEPVLKCTFCFFMGFLLVLQSFGLGSVNRFLGIGVLTSPPFAGLEIFLVLSNRFHYTTDVVLAVLLTFLWYTSAPICIAAKWWAQLLGSISRPFRCDFVALLSGSAV